MSSTWARPRTCPRGAGRGLAAWLLVPLAALSSVALVVAAPAAAHVIATPTFLASKASESISFSAPNERAQPMTAFSVTVPAGLEIEHAHPVDGWREQYTSSQATWTGGSLASEAEIVFGVTLRATAEPGVVEIDAEQQYPHGRAESWPVPLTILPAAESPSEHLALAGVIGLLGVVVVAVVALLAWRRRP